MRMDDDAIKAPFDYIITYIITKGEVPRVLTYSSVNKWLQLVK